jgi:hypothetical protein
MNLFISLYKINDINREYEIQKTLKQNLENSYIKRIIILYEPNYKPLLQSHKLIYKQINFRPSFADFYNFLYENEINIIANNDIYFPEKISLLWLKILSYSDFIILSRHEDSGIFRKEIGDSQDSWVFKGKPNILKACDFYFGIPGCDNRIAYVFHSVGYRVLNPSKTIISIHNHSSQVRNYSEKDRINGPYLNVKPTGFIRAILIKLLLIFLSKINYHDLSID